MNDRIGMELPDAFNSRQRMVNAAMQEIMTNYKEACLTDVARSYGVSLAYVSECVRQATGKTYKTLLQDRRLAAAAELLETSDRSIYEIIAAVGYENTSYFYRLFHKYYGVSPREYRTQRAAAQ